MKQPYEQGKRMNLLHGLYDEQMGQQVTGVYSYAEIGRMIGRSISAVKLADDEERLIARTLPDTSGSHPGRVGQGKTKDSPLLQKK